MPKYKNGKNTEPITFQHWKECVENADFVPFAKTRNRSLLAILYYSGCRVSQALSLRREDVTIQDGYVMLKLKPQKKGKQAIAKISLTFPFMKDFKRQLRKTGEHERIWQISRQAVWSIIKEVFGPKFYPHYFRLNRATHFLEDETTSVLEMVNWFGWKSSKTIDSYMGFCDRYTDKQAERLVKNP